jgi:Mlc titration factor MtfA (ptsG expression regulator)
MFHWLRNHRRDEARKRPFPPEWETFVRANLAHYDMLDGAADGTPPIADSDQIAEWVAVCSRGFLRLRSLAEKGHKTFLDAYGATNEAEFFAVATEEFFDRPLLSGYTPPTSTTSSVPTTTKIRPGE